MNIEIEHGIPIPNKSGSDGGEATKAIKSLSVGDSAVFPLDRRIGIYSIARYHKINVVTRKIDDKNFRIWRVE